MAKLNEKALRLLGKATADLTQSITVSLYTAPLGKRCVLSHAVLVSGGGDPGGATISIGFSEAPTDFIPSTTLPSGTDNDAFILQPVPSATVLLNKSYNDTQAIVASVGGGMGGSGSVVYLFGYIY